MAIEDELVTCTTCAGEGMVKGERCPDCRGRGITRVAHVEIGYEQEPEESDDDPDGLDDLPLSHLRERAEALGLSVDGTRDELVARIRAGKPDEPSIPDGDTSDELTKLNLAQLRERAVDLGIDPKGIKADLAGRIRAKVAENAGNPQETPFPVVQEPEELAGESGPG